MSTLAKRIGRALVTACALLLVGCGTQSLGTGLPSEVTCSQCHGSAANAAPPVSASGATATTDIGVGAHQAHVNAGALHGAIACSECHVVPTSIESPGHIINGPAPVVFGTLASTGGAVPAWDRTSATCSNVYCHGTQAPGGTNKTPVWTKVDGTQTACGTCHGNPPPLPHPARADCNTCHTATVLTSGAIDVAGGHHIDGKVDVNVSCSSCHGSLANAAPPQATTGATQTTDVRVGAHQAHVTDGPFHTAFACSECHVTPTAVDSPGHIVTGPAPVVFGALAQAGGAEPIWNRATPTCSNVYCHGSTLQGAGGTTKSPIWTQVDGTQASCTTCHGNPPPAPHPQRSDCASCHPATVTASGAIDTAGGHHIDGVVDVVAGF